MAERRQLRGRSQTSIPSTLTVPAGVGRRRAKSIASVVLPEPSARRLQAIRPGPPAASRRSRLADCRRKIEILDQREPPTCLGARLGPSTTSGWASKTSLRRANPARPRCTILSAKPMAIIGQVIRVKALQKAKNAPCESPPCDGPRKSNVDPYQKNTRLPMAATEPIVGPKEPRRRARARLARSILDCRLRIGHVRALRVQSFGRHARPRG